MLLRAENSKRRRNQLADRIEEIYGQLPSGVKVHSNFPIRGRSTHHDVFCFIYHLRRCCDLCSQRLLDIEKVISRTPLNQISGEQKATMASDLALIMNFMRSLFPSINHRLQQMIEHFTHFLTHYIDKLNQTLTTDSASLFNDYTRSCLADFFEAFLSNDGQKGTIYETVTRVFKPPMERARMPFRSSRGSKAGKKISERQMKEEKRIKADIGWSSAKITWYKCKTNQIILQVSTNKQSEIPTWHHSKGMEKSPTADEQQNIPNTL